MQTSLGDIYIKLNDLTPKHKAQILKDVENGKYNGSTFFRVVPDFVIQGGVSQTQMSDTNLTIIEHEINHDLYHFKGSVSIPRMSDEQNPLRISAPLQFFIVTGQKWTNEQLDTIEYVIKNVQMKNEADLFASKPENQWLRNINYERLKTEMPDSLTKLNDIISNELGKNHKAFHFSDSARKTYQMLGGAPMLDAQYTVVGKVVLGMGIVEKLSKSVLREGTESPVEPVVFTLKKVSKN